MISALSAETIFAKESPSLEKPREIIFGISKDGDREIDHALSTANNLLKFYGPEKVHMRIVAYYDGMRVLLAKEKKTALRVDALKQYGVEFVACGNTMTTKKIDKKELIDDIEIVTAGVAEIIERTKDGWININP
jgi:hypothetical protein